jgi:hypothetical protein
MPNELRCRQERYVYCPSRNNATSRLCRPSSLQTVKHRSATNIASPRLPIGCRDKPFTGDESFAMRGNKRRADDGPDETGHMKTVCFDGQLFRSQEVTAHEV